MSEREASNGREEKSDLNERQRRFAELVVEGRPAGRAYEEAGFKARGASADTEASKTLRNPKVARYVASLRAAASEKAKITRDRLIEILAETITSRPVDAAMENELCELRMGKDGPYAVFPDKIRCMERLVKMLGWEKPSAQDPEGKIAVVIGAGNSGLSILDLMVEAQSTGAQKRCDEAL